MITEQEAEQIAAVLATADGGSCWPCAGDLADEMVKVFPDYDWKQLVRTAGGWEDN